MKVELSQAAIPEIGADLLVVGLYDGGEVPAELSSPPGAKDAHGAYKKSLLLHPERPGRALVIGLGKREEMEAERARVAAALAVREAKRLKGGTIAWGPPGAEDDAGGGGGRV